MTGSDALESEFVTVARGSTTRQRVSRVRPRTEGRPRPGAGRVHLAIHLGSLLFGTAVLLVINRHQWFFGDEWDFILDRGLHDAERGLFAPHNEHWSTIPILMWRSLFSLFGLRTYMPYIGLLLLLHALLGHLLWRLLRRIGVSPWLATVLALTFLLNGAGFEELTSAFQFTFIGSVLFGFAHLLLADHDGPLDRRDAAGVLLSVVGLTFSGIGVPMIGVVATAVLIRRGWRAALATATPGALVYLTWLVLAGHEGLGTHPVTVRGLLRVPEYTWRGLVAAVDGSTPFPGAGAALLLALIGYLVYRMARRRPGDAPAIAAALGALFLYLVVAPGRVTLGFEQAESSRYAYIVWCLLLPSVGLFLEQFVGDDRVRQAVVLTVVAFGLLRGVDVLIMMSDGSAANEQALRGRFLAIAELAGAQPTVLNPLPDPMTSPGLTVDRLLEFRRAGVLPEVALGPRHRLGADGAMGVRFSPVASTPPAGQPTVVLVGGAPSQEAGAGCLRIGPANSSAQVALAAGRATIQVTSISGGEIRVLVGDGKGITVDPGRATTAQPSTPVLIEFDLHQGLPTVLLPPGESVVCGVRLAR